MNEEKEVVAEIISTKEIFGVTERFLTINNYSQFASLDVWSGMTKALQQFGATCLPFPINKLQAFFSDDMLNHYILSTAVSTRNNFTHVLFVGSAFLKEWVIKSIKKSGIKTIYWSLEDPHSLDQNSRFYDIADYYLTNEKRVKDVLPKAIYMPTAGNTDICFPVNDINAMPSEFKKDIIFAGNIYPSRQKTLEYLIPFIESKGYSFGIIGITKLAENFEKSPLKKYIINDLNGVVDHKWFTMAYGCAKIILNLERDPFYEYDSTFLSNKKYKIVGESLNPRAYEIALCKGGLQLIDDKRKEIESGQTIENNKHCIVFNSDNDLCKKIEYYLSHEDERKTIVDRAYEYVSENHVYINRAFRLFKKLYLSEGKQDKVIQVILNSFRKYKDVDNDK